MKIHIRKYIAQPLVAAIFISFIAHMFTLGVLQSWLFGEEGKSVSGSRDETLHIEMQAKSTDLQQDDVLASKEALPQEQPEKKQPEQQKQTEDPNEQIESPPLIAPVDEQVPKAQPVPRKSKTLDEAKAESKGSGVPAASLAAPVEEESDEVKNANKQAGEKETEQPREPVFAQNIDYIYTPMPDYPALAKRLRQEGTAMLKVRVNIRGEPVQIMLHSSSGYKILDKAALKSVKEWRFSPHLEGNKPVEAWAIIPVEFKLQR